MRLEIHDRKGKRKPCSDGNIYENLLTTNYRNH